MEETCTPSFPGVSVSQKLQENQTALVLTVFRTQRLAVEDEETGEIVMRRFPRGSIIIDPDTMWNRGLGSFNFTLAHEMYHWFAHRVHLAFMDIIGKPDDYERIQGHLESQANGVGTTVFYVLGALLVLGAGALLAAGRRRRV